MAGAEGAGDAERLGRGRAVGQLDVHAGVGAHSERGAQRLGGLGRADGDDLNRLDLVLEGLAEPDGLLDRWREGRRRRVRTLRVGARLEKENAPISSNGFYT